MKLKCCKKEDPHEGEAHHNPGHPCRKKTVRVILLVFMILNPVWGITETFTAMVVNFLVRHKAGSDGFTNSNWKVRDIIYIEHQKWELKSEELFKELTDDRKYIIDLREEITAKCSKPPSNPNKVIDEECNNRIPDDNVGIYFCDIVEHPELFQEAYRPLIKLWMVFNFTYLIPCPVMLLAALWKKQRIHIFIAYTVFQIIPILISFSVIIELNVTQSYTLCAIDYLYNRFPTRIFFTILVVLRIVLKLLEISAIYYFIWETMAEKAKRGFGLNSKNRARVAPLSEVRVHDEILQVRYSTEGDEASTDNEGARVSMTMSLAPSTVVDIFQKPTRHTRNSTASAKRRKQAKMRRSVPSEIQIGMSLADFEDENEDTEKDLMTTAETSMESTATTATTVYGGNR